MRCEYVRDRVLDSLLAGDAELAPGLVAHIGKCSACAAEAEALRRGVECLRAAPALRVEPPAGMKNRVFAALADDLEHAAAVNAERTIAAMSPARRVPIGEIVRRLALRPLPIAAGAAALCLVAIVVVATIGHRDGNTGDLLASVRQSNAMTDLEQLEVQKWVQEPQTRLRAIKEAKLVLQTIITRNDRASLLDAKRTIEQRRLVEAFRQLASEAPNDSQRRLVAEVLQTLQDIVARQL